jgi:hypothetical protein
MPTFRWTQSASVKAEVYAGLRVHWAIILGGDLREATQAAWIRRPERELGLMVYKLNSEDALANDLPRERLCRGDLVRLVEHHTSPTGEEGYSVEVLGAKGQTLAVVAVVAGLLVALRDDEVLSVRRIAV